MPNSPSCFQIFKSIGNVLDQSVSGWKQKTGLPLDSLVPQVKEAIQRMSCEYFRGSRPEIPFGNLVLQISIFVQIRSSKRFGS